MLFIHNIYDSLPSNVLVMFTHMHNKEIDEMGKNVSFCYKMINK